MTTREVFNTLKKEDGINFFNSKKTDKEIYDILISKGLTDDFETFTSEANKIFIEKSSEMSKEEILKKIEGAELTDEQLEQIAGGKGEVDDTTGCIIGVVGTVAVASAAASYL